MEGAPFKAKRLIGFVCDALDNRDEVSAITDLAEYHAEFISAEARNNICSARNAADAQRCFANGCVAGAVSKAVVDALEAIEVDNKDAERCGGAAARGGAGAE